jgi:hypothetical protein
VIARLHKRDPCIAHHIDKPVLLRNATAPTIGAYVLQGFGFADAGERISHHGIYQLEDLGNDSAIVLNPPSKVCAKAWIQDALSLSAQRQTLCATPPPS